MLSLSWHDALGTFGVCLVLFAYFQLQTGRLSSEALSYSVLNLTGSLFLLISLMYTFNFASVLIEIVWILISLIGLARYYQRYRARRAP